MSSETQTSLPLGDPWEAYKKRVAQLCVQLNHLGVHVDHGNEVVEYWYKLLARQLSRLSFDLDEESRSWQYDNAE